MTMKDGVEYFNTISPSADINLLYTGYEKCPPKKHCGGIRSHYLLHYILSGKGWVHSNDTFHQLSKGDLFCYFPEQALDYTSDPTDPWNYSWIGFQGRRAGEITRECGFTENRTVCKRPFSRAIADGLSKIIHVQSERQRGFELVSEGLLLQFLGILARELPATRLEAPTPSDSPESYNFFTPHYRQPYFYVEKMKQFMSTNYQKPISVQQVIDYIGVDRSYASRIFRKAENRTLQRYLIELRIGKARQLLSQRRLSIQAVAHSVGYNDYSSFERRFKIEVGCSPSEY